VKKALIAMSGGVDSSVAAWLMKESGYDCLGAMMKLRSNEDAGSLPDQGCCSLADVDDARQVADRLGLPFYVFNFTEAFAEQVIRRFVEAYRNGRTPNPCIDCNRYIKFERFLHRAREIDCDCVATGHYARIASEGGRHLLKKGLDVAKDQSYVLYAMTQEQLARLRFPLGGLTKSEVRGIAEAQGFMNAKKRDSQDICFAPDGDYAGFIEAYTGRRFEKGRFLDMSGRDLGEHAGIIRYTVGQRRGLGLAAEKPLYVRAICPDRNTVIVGRAEELYSRALTARNINLIPVGKLEAPLKAGAKIRYRQPEQAATVWQLDEDTLRVEFDGPQWAVARGQAVVLYDGDVVLGGGTIA
jgi:tRNA-specific 2-thiouridylase